MAEFCLKCWNELNDTKFTKKEVIISKDYDLCESCNEMEHVIVRYKKTYILKEKIKGAFRR